MRILVYITLLLASLIEVAYDLGAPGPVDLVGSRQTLACSGQPTSMMKKIFDDCLTEKGLCYRILDVSSPCGDKAGLDMSTYDGIWKFTCLQQGTNAEGTRECIVDQMKKICPEWEIMALSIRAMELLQECIKEIPEKMITSTEGGNETTTAATTTTTTNAPSKPKPLPPPPKPLPPAPKSKTTKAPAKPKTTKAPVKSKNTKAPAKSKTTTKKPRTTAKPKPKLRKPQNRTRGLRTVLRVLKQIDKQEQRNNRN